MPRPVEADTEGRDDDQGDAVVDALDPRAEVLGAQGRLERLGQTVVLR